MVVVDVDDVVSQEQASQTVVFAGGPKMSLMMMDSHSVNWGSEINDNPNLLVCDILSEGSRCCDGVRNGQQKHPHSMILVVKVVDDIVESLECSPSHEIQNNFSGLEEEAEYELRLRAMNR